MLETLMKPTYKILNIPSPLQTGDFASIYNYLASALITETKAPAVGLFFLNTQILQYTANL